LPNELAGPGFQYYFFRHGITLCDQLIELLLLLSNALGCPFFILRARGCGSLFDQLPKIVANYRDAVVEFWCRHPRHQGGPRKG
jgi:hypothetical protein